MPPFNMDRQTSKRELERAQNLLEKWVTGHITFVMAGFLGASNWYAEQDMDIPDSYIETLNALEEIRNSISLIASAIEEVNKTI